MENCFTQPAENWQHKILFAQISGYRTCRSLIPASQTATPGKDFYCKSFPALVPTATQKTAVSVLPFFAIPVCVIPNPRLLSLLPGTKRRGHPDPENQQQSRNACTCYFSFIPDACIIPLHPLFLFDAFLHNS